MAVLSSTLNNDCVLGGIDAEPDHVRGLGLEVGLDGCPGGVDRAQLPVPEMGVTGHQEPHALDLASGRGDERHVERQQHREHHPAAMRGDASGEALGDGGGEVHGRREADTRCRGVVQSRRAGHPAGVHSAPPETTWSRATTMKPSAGRFHRE